MTFTISPLPQALGAVVEGLDLDEFSKPRIDASVAEARRKGFEAGDPFDMMGAKHWTGKMDKVWEAQVGDFFDTQIFYGDIIYKDGVISTK